jgi:peptide/nickel transport system permease protein
LSVDVVTLDATPAPPVEAGVLESGRKRRWERLTLRAGILILGVVAVGSVAVRVFHLGHPYTPAYGATLLPPSLAHPFGTDAVGRDVFVRTLYATFTDVRVGVIATAVPLFIGLAVGGLAGYVGGWLSPATMRVVEFVQTFPTLVLILVIIAIVGPGMTGIYVGLILTGIPTYVRLTRAEMLVVREQQFILAAQTLGFTRRRIIFRHALPHLLRPNLVYSLSDVLNNILALAALSYLGLGVQPPTPEWGAIIADGQTYLLSSWWIATLPGLFVVIVGLGFSLTGEALVERLHLRVTGRAV